MKIYLASPLFNENEREQVRELAKILRSFGHEVYVPMEHQIENAYSIPNHEWAKKVFEEDVKQIKLADKVVAIYYGLYSDSGTAWECGFAYGLGIPVAVIDASKGDVSLMVAQASENPEFFNKVNQT